MKTVAFIPIKLNNERLPGKNTKILAGKPLLKYIIDTVLNVNGIDEVYLFCSDDSIKEYLPDTIKFLKRDKSLDASNASITKVINSFISLVQADIYVHLQAVSPFISSKSIETALKHVKEGKYDSALAVRPIHDFLWTEGKPFNYDPANIPRTQDLKAVYEETSGFYIFTKEIAKLNRRVGNVPLLYEVSDIEAVDIDEQIDFDIAEAIALKGLV